MTILMRSVVGGVGLAILVFTFWDVLKTILVASEAAGPFTSRMTSLASRVLARSGRSGGPSRGAPIVGPGFLMATLVTWVVLLWLGWTLVFVSGGSVVVDAVTREPASLWDTAYFTGFNVFTLGVGDFVATSASWRLIAVVSSFTGLFLVTFAITYLLSVTSAVVAGRALAVHVETLGGAAVEIVRRGWANGGGFASSFEQHLVGLCHEVASSAEQHLAYPVLHIFHSGGRATSASVRIAELADAMHILEGAVDDSADAPTYAAVALLGAIDRYVETASSLAGRTGGRSDPPSLDLTPLVEDGIPIATAGQFEQYMQGVEQRRVSLARVVESSGHLWSEKGSSTPPT